MGFLDELDAKVTGKPALSTRSGGSSGAAPSGSWNLDSSANQVKQWYQEQFGSALPIHVYGLDEGHKRMGYKYHDAMDIGLSPNDPKGAALVSYLRSAGMPFSAHSGASRSASGIVTSTGPHIHIGPPGSTTHTGPLTGMAQPDITQKARGGFLDQLDQKIRTSAPETKAREKQKSYDTPLNPDEESQFQTWKQTYAPNDSGADYDLRGAFKAGLKPDPQTGHWPDTFKKPNHPTFSNESQYATGTDAAKAGRWNGAQFIPPKRGKQPQPQTLGADLTGGQVSSDFKGAPIDAAYASALPGPIPQPAPMPPGVKSAPRGNESLPERVMANAVIPATVWAGRRATEGVLNATGSTLKKGATMMEYGPGGLGALGKAYDIPAKLRKAGTSIQQGAGELQSKDQDGGFLGTLASTVVRGAGAASVSLPQLIYGAPMGALNLPLQMAAERGEEGPVGLAKGAGEGLVYHFGMGATAPLGRVANALIWGTGATLQSAGEQKLSGKPVNWGESVGSGLTMGAMSTMGSERVRIEDPVTGKARFAGVRDLIGIQKGTIKPLPPSWIEPQNQGPIPKDEGTLVSSNVESSNKRVDELKAKREAILAKKSATQEVGGTLAEMKSKITGEPIKSEDTKAAALSQITKGYQERDIQLSQQAVLDAKKAGATQEEIEAAASQLPKVDESQVSREAGQASPLVSKAKPVRPAQARQGTEQDWEMHDALDSYDRYVPPPDPDFPIEKRDSVLYQAPKLLTSSDDKPLHVIDGTGTGKLIPVAADMSKDDLYSTQALLISHFFEDIQPRLSQENPIYSNGKFIGFDIAPDVAGRNFQYDWDTGASTVNPISIAKHVDALYGAGILNDSNVDEYHAKYLLNTTVHEITHEEEIHDKIDPEDVKFNAALDRNTKLTLDLVDKHVPILAEHLRKNADEYAIRNSIYRDRVREIFRTGGTERSGDVNLGNADAQIGQPDAISKSPESSEQPGSELRQAAPTSQENESRQPATESREQSANEPLRQSQARKFNTDDPREKAELENLQRFMGEKSVFKRRDGTYQEVYRASARQPEEMFGTKDIGPHFGTQQASNEALASMGRYKVKGEGYERMAGKKELTKGTPLTKGEKFEPTKGQPNTFPAYLKLENPVKIEDIGDNFSNPTLLAENLEKWGYITEEEKTAASQFKKTDKPAGLDYLRELLKSKGYDGIQYRNDFEHAGEPSYIPLDPTQVKSALGNWGSYDEFNADTLHAMDPISMAIKGAVEVGKMLIRGGKSFGDWTSRLRDKYGPDFDFHARDLWRLSLGKFISEDVIGAAKGIAAGLLDTRDALLKTFAPAARGEDALRTAMIVREKAAIEHRRLIRALNAVEDGRQLLEPLTKDEKYDFIDKIEKGQIDEIPAHLQPVARTMRRLNDEWTAMIQRYGKLNEANADYFGRVWKDPKKAQEVFADLFRQQYGKKPLAGSKSFLKQRSFNFFSEGIARGLEPISDNPVDHFVLKAGEQLKFIKANEIVESLKENKIPVYVRAGQTAPEGYAKVNDSMFTVFGGPDAKPQGGRLIRGEYYLPEPAARVLNNYLSPGLKGNAGFRGYMFIANTFNQVQLGLSAFHLGFVGMEAGTSKIALGLNQLANGMPLKALGSFGSAASIVGAPIETLYKGSKMRAEALEPGTQGQKYMEAVAAHQLGGGRFDQERIYTNAMMQKMKTVWRESSGLDAVIRAGGRLPFAVIEAASNPIMKFAVPRMKLGVAYDLYRMEIDKDPNIDEHQARLMFSKIVDTADNRIGQMVYDNLFWNQAAKNIVQATIRSPGWNLGTIREVGGGATDILTKTARGQGLSYRTAYLLALPAYTAFIGSIIHYLYNGKAPDDLKDALFPRTGIYDDRGNPERVSMPTYIKDMIHYDDLWRVGPHSRRVMINKLHPLLHMAGDLMENEDYFGTQIYNPDDTLGQKGKDLGKYLGKSLVPYGISNVMKERERGQTLGKSAPAFFGLTPAPASINQTKAEEMMYSIEQAQRPAGSKTHAEADRGKALFQIRQAIRSKDIAKVKSLTQEAQAAGLITSKDLGTDVIKAQTPDIQRRFEQLRTPEERLKVWNVMEPKEQKQVLPIMIKTIPKIMELPPALQTDLLSRYKNALKSYTSPSP